MKFTKVFKDDYTFIDFHLNETEKIITTYRRKWLWDIADALATHFLPTISKSSDVTCTAELRAGHLVFRWGEVTRSYKQGYYDFLAWYDWQILAYDQLRAKTRLNPSCVVIDDSPFFPPLEELMRQNNLDEIDLRKKLRISEQTLEKLLHLQIPISNDLLGRMIKAFGVETSAEIYKKHNELIKIKKKLEKEVIENDIKERI